MQNKMLPNLRQIHSVPPFKTCVKSLTSKTEGMLLYVFIMFETYVKSNASKP